jgi:N-acetylmuramoyl-L-alanine amidase
MKVAVDPGHGKSNRTSGVYDPGAEHLANGVKYQEADIALGYGLALKDVLRARQIDVFMTRESATDDAPVGERAGNAERADCDMFISLHLNDNESVSINGLEVLFRDTRYEPFARAMHDALIRTTGFKPRGAKQRLDLAVLKFQGPALLIELGFISNDRDRTDLLIPQVRAAVCETIADIIQNQPQMDDADAAAEADAAPTAMAPSYHLPPYARDLLGSGSGIPWDQARPTSDMDFYIGLVKGSFHKFPGAVFYESKFSIDNDGSGGNEDGDIHHKPNSSLHNAADNALDARTMPFIVLPSPKPSRPQWADLGIDLGDLGVCFFKNGRSCAVIYGDHGPNYKLGEGSMQAARELGINPDPNVGGIEANEVPPGVIHIVFPNSRKALPKGASGLPRTADTVQSIHDRAWDLFAQFKNSAPMPPAGDAADARPTAPPAGAPRRRRAR